MDFTEWSPGCPLCPPGTTPSYYISVDCVPCAAPSVPEAILHPPPVLCPCTSHPAPLASGDHHPPSVSESVSILFVYLICSLGSKWTHMTLVFL